MANITYSNLEITSLSGGRVRIDVRFSLSLTATEQRLTIPSRVYIKLMEQDDARDTTHFYAEHLGTDIDTKGNADDAATGWMYAGMFSATGSHSFSRIFNRSSLPNESGKDEFYCVVRCEPDIPTSLRYTNRIDIL